MFQPRPAQRGRQCTKLVVEAEITSVEVAKPAIAPAALGKSRYIGQNETAFSSGKRLTFVGTISRQVPVAGEAELRPARRRRLEAGARRRRRRGAVADLVVVPRSGIQAAELDVIPLVPFHVGLPDASGARPELINDTIESICVAPV